jgi:hypothetical protein
MYRILFSFFFALISFSLFAQKPDSIQQINESLDSLYIFEVEDKKGPDKVLHAEPLYIDLIRDLGARKGEKEWNIGLGLTDKSKFDSYTALVEYEWAPINRLGLEVELPFTFYYPTANGYHPDSIPGSKLDGLKLAAQYSFFVSEKMRTTLAVGYIHEFQMTPFNQMDINNVYSGNVYNPFFVAAKRWGNNWHTLLYTGPEFYQSFNYNQTEMIWQINMNFHYMITGTRNFLGVEFNQEVYENKFDMVIRPQIRVGLADNLLIGIVSGIPINREFERLSSFVRLIYEPGHKLTGKTMPPKH